MNSNYLLTLMKLAAFLLNKIDSYFLLILVLCSFSGFSQIIITELADPNNAANRRYVEIYNSSGSSVNLSDYYLLRWTNANAAPTSKLSLSTYCGSSLGANTFCIVSNESTSDFKSTYGFVSNSDGGTGGTVDSNGDDNIAIVTSASGITYSDSSTWTVIDMFGVAGEDGSGTGHEFEDGRAERKSSVTTPQSTWSASDWNIDNDSGGGDGSQNAPGGYDPGYWIGATTIDTWNGLSSSAWATNGNWASNTAPVSGDNVFIRDSSTDPIISTTGVQVTNITVESSGVLTINAGKDLTVSGNFSNSGTVTMSSDADEYSSLIVEGTSSGNITYNVWVASTSTWDLVGSPVDGASVDATSLAANGGDYAIQPYNNQTNAWTQTTASSVSTTLGKGYAMAMSSAGTVVFTGSVYVTGDGKDYTISNYDGVSSGTQWNLVANPYPSFLALNSSTSGTDTDFITQNATTADVLGSGSNEDAVWAWDGSTYQTYNNSDGALYIAPGQGFFVASKSGTSNTLKFLESMQTTNTGDNFITGDAMDPDDRAELFIGVSQADIDRYTKIFFLDNTTDGSDATYDGRNFPMGDNSTSIYSRLVEGDQGVNLGVQALAYSEMWDKVIPIGISATAGEELAVSVTHKTTPADLKIYLEDTQEGTFTLINNEDFVLTPTSDLEGVGRFFIHMTANALSDGEVNTSLLNAYKEVDSNYITIEGLATQSTSTEVSLFNILGTKVMDATLDNTSNTQMISTNGLSTGIYVIKLESGQNQLTKKLIIR